MHLNECLLYIFRIYLCSIIGVFFSLYIISHCQEQKHILFWEYSDIILIYLASQTHSSVLAWRIPGTGEPGGLPSMGSHRVGHD